MTKERLDSISRIMAILRAFERGKKDWPTAECDTTERDWQWPHEIAHDLVLESEQKLEQALLVLAKGTA